MQGRTLGMGLSMLIGLAAPVWGQETRPTAAAEMRLPTATKPTVMPASAQAEQKPASVMPGSAAGSGCAPVPACPTTCCQPSCCQGHNCWFRSCRPCCQTNVSCPTNACAPANPCDSGDPCGGSDTPWGPTLPEDVHKDLPFRQRLACNNWRVYGWADMGYTYASVGSGGPLSVQPRENRFGNEFLVNQLAIVLEKTLKKDEFNWGFKSVYYAGADASLLTPLGGFRNSDPRFGHDFRDLYVSAHLPVLTQGGIDVRVGRMTTIVGYESALAPYRPFYSNDYQWFYSQDGAFTGALATFHLNDRLNVTHGVTMGANTFFRNRSGACYLGQINYWTDCEKNTLFNSSIYVGDDCIFAAPGRDGDLATVLELRIQHKWSKYLTQIVQSDMGWDRNIPNIGTGSWYSLYSIWVAHATPTLDVNLRAEWFRDIFGTRTGIDAHYAEVTLGLDWHPKSWLRIRPEIRGDFANRPAFGVRGPNDYSQLTLAIDALLSF